LSPGLIGVLLRSDPRSFSMFKRSAVTRASLRFAFLLEVRLRLVDCGLGLLDGRFGRLTR
jgi:hypothetical protein